MLTLTANTGLYAQDKGSADQKDFKIVVARTDDGVQLTCEHGCAWKVLKFSLNDDRPQAIDEYGMTHKGGSSSAKKDDLAAFLFTLTKSNGEIALKGMEGTAWTQLSFTLPADQQQAIDGSGMTD